MFVKEVVLRQLEKARDATAVSSAVSMQKVARRYLARGGIRTFKILKPLAENVRRMGANASDVLAAAADSKLALQRLEDEMAKPGVLSAVEAVDCIDVWMVKTLAQLQEAGVLSQEQVVVAVPPHWPACSLLCHHCAGGGVGWPRSGGSGARDSACTGRDASR